MIYDTITIKIMDNDELYINNELYHFSHKIDKECHTDDINKRVLIALANHMGYDPISILEGVVSRLYELLDTTK